MSAELLEAFLARIYVDEDSRERFLADPRKTSKGKPHAIIGLHQLGLSQPEIVAKTRSPKSSVAKMIAAYESGASADPDSFLGKDLSGEDLCRLLGLAAARGWDGIPRA